MINFENATEKKIDATRTERHFCKCYACKQSTTIDFEVICWSFPWFNANIGRTVWEPRTEYLINGKHIKNTYIAECPRCGASTVKRSRLKVKKLSVNHVCDDRCQKATSETCECSCNGLNHGIKNKPEVGCLN